MFQVSENSRNIRLQPVSGESEFRQSTTDCEGASPFSPVVVLRGTKTVKSRHRDRRRTIDALAAPGVQEDNRSLPTI